MVDLNPKRCCISLWEFACKSTGVDFFMEKLYIKACFSGVRPLTEPVSSEKGFLEMRLRG